MHTPGPWEIDAHPADIRPTEIVKRFPDGTAALVCELTHSVFRDNQAANARLIAAAPGLLEALVRCQEFLAGAWTAPESVIDQVRTAISAAEC